MLESLTEGSKESTAAHAPLGLGALPHGRLGRRMSPPEAAHNDKSARRGAVWRAGAATLLARRAMLESLTEGSKERTVK